MTMPWPPTCCQGFIQEGAFTHTEICSRGGETTGQAPPHRPKVYGRHRACPKDDRQYHYARLIEGGAPTRYVRFTARKARDAWVEHDVLNRYKVVPVSSVNALLSRVTWADVDGVSTATEPTTDPQLTNILEEINAINREVANLQDKARTKYDEVAKVVAGIYNEGKATDEHIDHECIIVDTYHECAESPTLRCVYPDEMEEFCVFCGEPEERK